MFEITFLSVYMFEQLLLVLLTISYPEPSATLAGIFAVVVITTISFEKICMESRYRTNYEKMKEAEMRLEEGVNKRKKESEEFIQILESRKI